MDILSSFFDLGWKFISSVLPLSPFRQFLGEFAVIAGSKLGWLNWLVPVGPMLTVMGAWLAAITLFYAYSALARWIKIIGD